MFKVLAYILIAAPFLTAAGCASFGLLSPDRVTGIAGTATLGMFTFLWTWPFFLAGGICLCIHKYLHRDDNQPRESTRYTPESSAPASPDSAPRQMGISAFGR